MIAFVGSVFSPYYALARRRAGPAGADPLAHAAFNCSLYGRDKRLWTMTERGAGALQRRPRELQIGPSAWRWNGDALHIEIDEWTVPWPRRVRGHVVVRPLALQTQDHALDANGRHRWWPVAPMASIEVALDEPLLRWRGRAYLDANHGSEPLEDAFAGWSWAHAHLDGGRSMIVYDVRRRDGSAHGLSLRFHADRPPEAVSPPPVCALPAGGWGIRRPSRSDAKIRPNVLRSFEDGPFYTRSLLSGQWHGEPLLAVHECVDLDRFAKPWVQGLLPFRMPRRR